MGIYYVFIFLLGLAIGSFLNVCIYRIPLGQSIANPPSHCFNCGTRLATLDLIPVFSYLFLRGRCRYCGKKFSARYMFIELLTAGIFTMLFYKYSVTLEFLAAAFLMSILIAVFFIDLDHRIIPNGLVIAGLIGGILVFVYNFVYPFEIYGDRHWYNPLIGAAVGSGTLLLVALIGYLFYKTDDAMGMGDVKIFAPIGILLGWRLTIIALLLAIFIAGISSLVLIIIRKKNRKSTIPFGPFIVTGTFIALMWGYGIISWYTGGIR